MKSALRFLLIYIFSLNPKRALTSFETRLVMFPIYFIVREKNRKKNICAGAFIAKLVIEITPRLANCTVRLHMADSALSRDQAYQPMK